MYFLAFVAGLIVGLITMSVAALWMDDDARRYFRRNGEC